MAFRPWTLGLAVLDCYCGVLSWFCCQAVQPSLKHGIRYCGRLQAFSPWHKKLFAEGEVNIGEYLPSRRRGKYSRIFTEHKANNCFSIIFGCEHQKEWNNELKRGKHYTRSMA